MDRSYTRVSGRLCRNLEMRLGHWFRIRFNLSAQFRVLLEFSPQMHCYTLYAPWLIFDFGAVFNKMTTYLLS